MPKSCDADNCGIDLKDDSLSKQSHTIAFSPTSSSAKPLKNLKATTKKLQGACVTRVNDTPVHNSTRVSAAISEAKKQGGAIRIKFALKLKLTVTKLRRAFDEYNLLIPPSLTKKHKLKHNSDSGEPETDSLQPDDDGSP